MSSFQGITRTFFEWTASISTATIGDPGGSGSTSFTTRKCFSLLRGVTAVHLVSSSFFGLKAFGLGRGTLGTFFEDSGSTLSPHPMGGHTDQRSRVVHVPRELDRLTADLAVLDVPERSRRQVHRGTKLFPAVRALDSDELLEL